MPRTDTDTVRMFLLTSAKAATYLCVWRASRAGGPTRLIIKPARRPLGEAVQHGHQACWEPQVSLYL
jgi:hypothetical protein